MFFTYLYISIIIIIDVSQPSLGTDNEHERLITPPLSPMYSLDGQSGHVSISSKAGKIQVVYAKLPSTTNMETHWEESIQQSEKKITKTFAEYDVEDSESDLLAIPESDVSDNTLQGSVQVLHLLLTKQILKFNLQDPFEEIIHETFYPPFKSDKTGTTSKIQEYHDNMLKKDVLASHLIKNTLEKRPTWFIGSEEESLKSNDYKKYEIHKKSSIDQNLLASHQKWYSSDHSPTSTKMTSLGTSSLASTLAVVAGVPNIQMSMAKTVTTDSHRQVTSTSVEAQHTSKPILLGKHKRIVEASSAPVSDCDDCFKNNQIHAILPAPSLERLLPIGSTRSPGT